MKKHYERFRRALSQRRVRFTAWLQQDTSTCLPDGCTPTVLDAVDETIERLNCGTFGTCTICHEEIETQFLELDFTTSVCLGCYSDVELKRLERDLELAAQVQKLLLPQGVPALDGLEIAVHARPAGVVGGDYYDFFCNRNVYQGFVIADVMGKGLAASMLMSNLQAALRLMGNEHDDPSTLAEHLNRFFQHNLKLIRFITLFLATWEPEGSVFRYANAGHHPPLRYEPESGRVYRLSPTGPALGLMHDAPFRTESFTLAPGDLVLMYTDGLVEARNTSGVEFGDGRMETYIEQNAGQSAQNILQGLIEEVRQFSPTPFQDDTTVMVLKRR